MKKLFFLVLIASMQFSCSNDDSGLSNNPNLVNLKVNFQLNLNLPEYSNLQYAGNSYVTYSNGISGVVIYNLNNSQYFAYELSDPNHPLKDCSIMRVNGIEASCSCEDGNTYNIITGELSSGEGQYPMRAYRVEKSGNNLRIYN